MLQKNCGKQEVFESGTRTYNCHAYAWHVKEGGNKVWINNLTPYAGNLNVYWNDYSYCLYDKVNQPHKENLKVFYGSTYSKDDHSAITTSDPTIFISKMGPGVLASHIWNGLPFYDHSNLKYYVHPYIGGPGSCFSGQTVSFTAYNPPASYSWTCSGNLTPGSASGDTKSFTANNYGDAWVAINSGLTQVTKFSIKIFSYAPDVSYIDGLDNVLYNPNGSSSPSTDEDYTVVLSNTDAPPYNYVWGMDGNPSYYSLSQNGNTVTVSFKIDFSWSFKLYVNVYNSHGQGYEAKYITFNGAQKSGSAPKVYPNPVSDILNVEIDQEIVDRVKALQQNSGKNLNADPVFDIRFFNGYGLQLRQQSTKGSTVQLNVSDLPNGLYFLYISDGVSGKPVRVPVIVKH